MSKNKYVKGQQAPITVGFGSKNLREAFMKDLQTMGFQTKVPCQRSMVCPSQVRKGFYATTGRRGVTHYQGETQYGEALMAFAVWNGAVSVNITHKEGTTGVIIIKKGEFYLPEFNRSYPIEFAQQLHAALSTSWTAPTTVLTATIGCSKTNRVFDITAAEVKKVLDAHASFRA